MKKTVYIVLLITATLLPSFSFAQEFSSSTEEIIVQEKTKTEKIEEAFFDKIEIYENGNTRIEINRVVAENEKVTIFINAWKNDIQLGFGKDGNIETERIRIHNPPIMIPDGTTHTECNLHQDCYEVNNYTENPKEAIKQLINEVVKNIGKEGNEIIEGSIGHTVDIFYPSLNGIAFRLPGVDELFSTMKAGAGTHHDDTSATQETVSLWASGTINLYQYDVRMFYILDTSAIGSADTISSAVFSVYGTTKTSTLGGNLEIVSAISASESTIANADYAIGNFGSTSYTTPVAFSALTTGAYQDFPFNAAGIAAINKTGNTKFGFLTSFDKDNIAPTWGASQGASYTTYWITQAGTTNDPYLTVTHSVVTASSSTELCTGEACTKNLEVLYLIGVTGLFAGAFFIGKKIL